MNLILRLVSLAKSTSDLLGGLKTVFRVFFFIPKFASESIRPLSRLGAILATVRQENMDDSAESSSHNLLLR